MEKKSNLKKLGLFILITYIYCATMLNKNNDADTDSGTMSNIKPTNNYLITFHNLL